MQGVQGNDMKEARVFGHDAVEINWNDDGETIVGAVISLSKLSGGTGYADGPVTVATTSGTDGAGLTVSITASGGVIQTATIVAAGTAYEEGEIVTIATGGANAKLKVSTAIPNTSERGCCLYIGKAGHVNVKMESGDVVTFYNVNAGTFLPVLVTHVSLPEPEREAANDCAATTAAYILAIF